jgi:tetratricopeptide (TPR) repeat protein
MNLPEDLLRNPHFSRYYRTWQKNQLSIVFIPLAQICREQGLLAEAKEICETGLLHHPNSVSGRLMLARIYFDLDQMDNARRFVEEILQELPGQREAKFLRDKIMRCRGLDKNDQRQGGVQSAPLWENPTMAKIYADQGEPKIALKILERVLSREPQNGRARQLYEELK